MNSGTSALHLHVKAEGIGKGDEVITTPFNFVASANCLLYEGATPRFVDIDIDSYNLDPRLIAQSITRPRAGSARYTSSAILATCRRSTPLPSSADCP